MNWFTNMYTTNVRAQISQKIVLTAEVWSYCFSFKNWETLCISNISWDVILLVTVVPPNNTVIETFHYRIFVSPILLMHLSTRIFIFFFHASGSTSDRPFVRRSWNWLCRAVIIQTSTTKCSVGCVQSSKQVCHIDQHVYGSNSMLNCCTVIFVSSVRPHCNDLFVLN